MSKEYIEREAVIEKCNLLIESLTDQRDQYIQHIIGGIGLVRELILTDEETAVPAADVAPVVHGEWITHGIDENSDLTILKCSNCGRKQFGYSNYCGACGAEMSGGSK